MYSRSADPGCTEFEREDLADTGIAMGHLPGTSHRTVATSGSRASAFDPEPHHNTQEQMACENHGNNYNLLEELEKGKNIRIFINFIDKTLIDGNKMTRRIKIGKKKIFTLN
jgi:hypothetical protein